MVLELMFKSFCEKKILYCIYHHNKCINAIMIIYFLLALNFIKWYHCLKNLFQREETKHMALGYQCQSFLSSWGPGRGRIWGGDKVVLGEWRLCLSWRWGYYFTNPISYLSCHLSLDRRDIGQWQTHVKKTVLG